jgi:hypothetical protein
MKNSEKRQREDWKKEILGPNKRLSEAKLEEKFRERVESAGGLCFKLSPLINNGIPDRLVILPGGVKEFVEMKRVDSRGVPTDLSPVQKSMRKKLEARGSKVWKVYDFETMDQFFDYVLKQMP